MMMEIDDDDNKVAVVISTLNEVILYNNDSSTSDEDSSKRKVQQIENKLQKEGISADIFMSVLAPNLFSTTSKRFDDSSSLSLKLSSKETIEILIMMVTSNQSKYLKAASKAVKKFVFKYDAERKNDNSASPPFYVSDNLLNLMVFQLSDSLDVEVSSNATETLLLLCCQMEKKDSSSSAVETSAEEVQISLVMRSLNAISQAFQVAWEKKKQRKNFQHSSTSCVRCVTAIIMLLSSNNEKKNTTTTAVLASETGLENEKKKALDNCLLPMLLDESDILLQMSAFDLMEQLVQNVSSAAGDNDAVVVNWVLSKSLLEPIFGMAGDNEQHDPDPSLGPLAIRLLSRVCSMQQQNTTTINYEDTTSSSWIRTQFHHVLRNTEGRSEIDRVSYLDAVSCFVSSTAEALELILDDDLISENWLSIAVSQPKLQSSILHSVAGALNSHFQNSTLCMRLFTMFGQINSKSVYSSPLELVTSLAKSSITEIRLGAYTLLEAVTCQPTFARLVFMGSNGLFETLLTRKGIEMTTEGKEAKFRIVKAILSQQRLVSLIDPNLVKVLEKYVSQGPYYVETLSWDVATL